MRTAGTAVATEPRPGAGKRKFRWACCQFSGDTRRSGKVLREADDGQKPDALVPADASRVLHGLFATGTRSGSVVTLNGTSMACARMTRWCADQLAAGIFPSRATVAAYAVAGEAALPGAPPLPAARSGAGRVVFGDPVPPHRTRYDPA
ncbi:MAG: hypothetical protein U1E70_07320 [Acetobacteraceae bacterium]